jgi:hypothetical protein
MLTEKIAEDEKNWWGAIAHPSDIFVHWSETNLAGKSKAIYELRAAWDLAHSTAELTAAFDLLIKRARNTEASDQAELNAGASL